MSDDALIRLSNLKATDLTPTLLAEKVGGRTSYWSDLLRGKKSFGEKVARKIEEKLGWPRGCLDDDGGCPEKPISFDLSRVGDSSEAQNAAPSYTNIPTNVIYTPANLNATIVLLGSLLMALDQRSREVIVGMLGDLANKADEAQDIANKASALATVQRPVSRNAALNRAITRQRETQVETGHGDLEPPKGKR
jgi:hypothetical protein